MRWKPELYAGLRLVRPAERPDQYLQLLREMKNAPALFQSSQRSMKIRQVIKGSRTPHRKEAADIQAKKINSRLAFVRYVSSHIKFGEAREPGQRRQPPSPDAAHPERNDPD